MNEPFAHNGLWWLPENPENRVSGKLVFTPSGGPVLKVLGTLDASLDWQADFNPSLVVGVSDTGKRVTLQNCRLKSSSISGTIAQQSFRVSTVFVGVHFSTAEEIKFKRLSVHYANLDEWVGKQAFDVDRSEHELTIRYTQPEPVQVDIDDYEMTVGALGPSTLTRRFKEVRVTQKAWISLSAKGEERSLDQYLDTLYHVRNFLTLAMSEPTFPLALEGIGEATKEKSDTEPDYYTPVSIFYQVPFMPADGKQVEYFEMLFTLPVIQEQIQTYISNWMTKAALLKPVHDLYFSTLYNPQLYMEGEFLSLAQAIETYHRRMFGGKYQPDDEYMNGLYQAFVQAIPDKTGKDFKTSLKEGRLKFANEFSLRKRLKELIGRLSDDLSIGFMGSEESRRSFVNLVCDTRNFLTHYTPELHDRAAQGRGLGKLTRQLKGLLTICLLEELGFTFEAINEIVHRSRRVRFLFKQ